MTNKSEIWKELPGVPGVEVSTFGRVRTLDRVTSSKERTQFLKGRVLKQSYNGHGYMQVHFRIDGKCVNKYVHRLVAQTFIENNGNLPEVNHKDCDPKNNAVSNLEWCTAKYNSQYREKFGVSNTESLGHPVFAINLNTLEVSSYPSQGEASRELGVFKQNINRVTRGKLKQTGGYWFTNADKNAVDAIKRKFREGVKF